MHDSDTFVGFENEDDYEDEIQSDIESIAPNYNYDSMRLSIDPVGRVEIGDSLLAYRFWVTKCLLTERYKYLAYDTDFGVEFEEIIRSNPDRDVAESEIMREIDEALSVDERTQSVDDFEFEWNGSHVYVKFVIETIYGEEQVEMEMDGDNIDESRVSFTSLSG